MQIKDEINRKYYVSDKDFEDYHFPFKQNDGYTESAISLGKAIFSCYWTFGDSEVLADYISVKINEYFDVAIAYENGPLMALFVQNQEEKDSLDY
ncbi:MAG: hypothetical protein M0R39_14510 [Prolixibacteraceae bacterium]|nr:hypothetical protein [Prolixibacteraceae bacterium]